MPVKKRQRPGSSKSQSETRASVADSGPVYPAIASAMELRDPGQVLRSLGEIDWAFTGDDTGFLSHDVHPYPAKFIPQIPGHLISRLSLPGEVVLDPFGGSGTTATEAVRLGRRAISIDANPLATLIGRVKTGRWTEPLAGELSRCRAALARRLARLPASPHAWEREFADRIPAIPNMEKWFPASSRGELALIRHVVANLSLSAAQDIALVALSRVVLKASFQDTETRYASRPRPIPAGDVIRRFLRSLERVSDRVAAASDDLKYGVAEFKCLDSRRIAEADCPTGSVHLVVTSPPYGNSNDYHLYHRFRLFWLGFDPRELGKIEIGSHLRHQKEKSGFQSYLDDMGQCFRVVERVLAPGRYAGPGGRRSGVRRQDLSQRRGPIGPRSRRRPRSGRYARAAHSRHPAVVRGTGTASDQRAHRDSAKAAAADDGHPAAAALSPVALRRDPALARSPGRSWGCAAPASRAAGRRGSIPIASPARAGWRLPAPSNTDAAAVFVASRPGKNSWSAAGAARVPATRGIRSNGQVRATEGVREVANAAMAARREKTPNTSPTGSIPTRASSIRSWPRRFSTSPALRPTRWSSIPFAAAEPRSSSVGSMDCAPAVVT